MPLPRLIVLTPQKLADMPREWLTDRDRFPLEAINTTDLAKARTWEYPVGVRRYLKRNSHLTGYRRVSVDRAMIEAARAADKTAAQAPAEAPPAPRAKPARKVSSRSTKTDPNKRTNRAARKRAVRAIRAAAGKPRRKGRKIKLAA